MKKKKAYKSFNVPKVFSNEQDAWLISYSDLVTNLLCFFMIFFSAKAIQEKDDFAKVINSLKLSYAETQGAKNQSKTFDHNIIEKLKEIEKISGTQTLIYKKFLQIEFPKGDMFLAGSAKVRKSMEAELFKVIKELHPYRQKYQFTVVAYTDPTKVKASKTRWWNSNEELSALRALNVQNLFYQNGFAPGEVFVLGQGVKVNKMMAEDLQGNVVDPRIHSKLRTISIRLELVEPI